MALWCEDDVDLLYFNNHGLAAEVVPRHQNYHLADFAHEEFHWEPQTLNQVIL